MIQQVVLRPLADAFLQVGVYVALFAGVAAWVRVRHGDRLTDVLADRRLLGPALGALLGVSPGCGGAILVVGLYVRGRLSYGSVAAALTATMGDSSFVLMAGDPVAALQVHALLLCTGLATGYVVDGVGLDPRAHRRRDAEPGTPAGTGSACSVAAGDRMPARTATAPRVATGPAGTAALVLPTVVPTFWLVAAAGVLLSVPLGFHLVDPAGFVVGPVDYALLVGVLGTALCLLVFAASGRRLHDDEAPMPTDVRSSFTQAAVETAFVVVWVAAAMVATALLAVLPLPGLARMPLAGLAGVVVAATVGLIPGCGAQIAFTGLYLSGVVPLPVLLANAVAQDGDALLPLIALDRRAAVVTCALTTLPALTVGWTALLVL